MKKMKEKWKKLTIGQKISVINYGFLTFVAMFSALVTGIVLTTCWTTSVIAKIIGGIFLASVLPIGGVLSWCIKKEIQFQNEDNFEQDVKPILRVIKTECSEREYERSNIPPIKRNLEIISPDRGYSRRRTIDKKGK